MSKTQALRHTAALTLILTVAVLLNALPVLLSHVPPQYNLSSDATVFATLWQEGAAGYSGAFAHDQMFQQFTEEPTGVFAADRALVWVAQTLHVDLLTWSIVVSAASLAAFLVGVYALVWYALRNRALAIVIALASIIPVVSLGLSSWGFMVGGFVPKETGLSIAVWLTILYVRGIREHSWEKITYFFVLLGLCANWYSPLFYQYALLLFTAEAIRTRAVKKELFLYAGVFFLVSPLALWDIFVTNGHFTQPIVSLIIAHYTWPLHSLSYLLLHYLRKQIIYALLLTSLWWAHRHVLKKESPAIMRLWWALWWAALVWSLVGVGIEVWAPLYEKYLLSRTSVWFYFASMVLVGALGWDLCFWWIKRTWITVLLFCGVLLCVLLAQSSLLNYLGGLRDATAGSADYRQYLSVVTQLKTLVPDSALVLADPDDKANTIRSYGGIGVWVSVKDGNVILYDGAASQTWYARYEAAEQVFATKDFSVIRTYALQNGLRYYFFDTRDITASAALLKQKTILQSGDYGLAKLQ